MAKKTSSNEVKKKDVSGIILLSVSIILIISFISGGEERFAGAVGSFINLFLERYIGAIRFLIPVILIWMSVNQFYQKRGSLTPRYSDFWGFIVFIAGGCSLLSLMSNAGGEAGSFISEIVLRRPFGTVGAYIISVTTVLIAIILITDLSIKKALNYTGAKFNELIEAGKKKKYSYRKKRKVGKVSEEKKEKNFNKKRKQREKEEQKSDIAIHKHPACKYSVPADFLKSGKKAKKNTFKEEERGEKLLEVLRNFNIDAEISSIQIGPSITRYEVSLPMDIQLSKIRKLASNIAMTMAAKTVRLLTPIPGKSTVGVEVPAVDQEIVPLRSLIETPEFKSDSLILPYCLGKAVNGEMKIADLTKMPHVLLAGSTGSGKSVAIHSLINSIIFSSKPEDVQFLLMDPKRVELPVYNGIPHMAYDVVTDSSKAVEMLQCIAAEMDDRYDKLAKYNVANINAYNAVDETENMPRLVVVIDELADLMAMAKDRVENAIIRIAQMARAVGIHLVLATQRPSVDVITGIIKANLPARIAFKVLSGVDSRTILDMNGAEKLLGKGDMLYQPPDMPQPIRIQGCFISRNEVKKVTGHIENLNYEFNRKIDIKEKMEKINKGAESEYEDELYPEAVKLVIKENKASISLIQRRLRIGYNRAARIIDTMRENEIIGDEAGVKGRSVLVSKEYLESIK